MAEDTETGRLFVTDNSQVKTTLVVDINTGKLLSLGATTYAVKKSWDLPPNPNSMLLSVDGQTLFVTVKQPFNKDHSTSAPDSVVRIVLDK